MIYQRDLIVIVIEKKRELTNKKYIKGKYHLTFYLKDIFGFAQHQEKPTSRLGYKLTLTRTSDYAVLNKTNATVVGKSKINSIEW